jgi:hypothetical protein
MHVVCCGRGVGLVGFKTLDFPGLDGGRGLLGAVRFIEGGGFPVDVVSKVTPYLKRRGGSIRLALGVQNVLVEVYAIASLRGLRAHNRKPVNQTNQEY